MPEYRTGGMEMGQIRKAAQSNFVRNLISRLLILMFSAAVLASTSPGSIASDERTTPEETRIVILHTNDRHGHIAPWQGWEGDLSGKTIGGFDRLAAVVMKMRKGAEHVMLLDAGDALSDTGLAMESRGEAVVQLMNALKYDAMTIGNHELDFGTERLRELIGKAGFPLLAANIMRRGQLFAQPYVIRQFGPVRVGILGIAYPNTPLTTSPENVANLEFVSGFTAAQRFLPEMRGAGAQLIIVLSHLGLGADIRLAKSLQGIDVIVGGHSHNRMMEATQVGKTLIVQAGAHGSDVGMLELTFRGTEQVDKAYRLVTLDNAAISGDPEIASLARRLSEPLAQGETQLGESGAWLARAQTLAGTEPRKRDEESPVDSLFADILRDVTGADIVFLPGVGYGVAIPPGPITAPALKNLLPHESRVVKMELDGAQILEVLEQSIENIYSEDETGHVGGMVQVSGLEFMYDERLPFGNRILKALIGGQPLRINARYRVVTNSLLSQGGHRYLTFLQPTVRTDLGTEFGMISNWLMSHPRITPPVPGRILRKSQPVLDEKRSFPCFSKD